MNTQVLIVGSGVAGLYCALNLDGKIQVTLISKGEVSNCNSHLAQGGISVCRDEDDLEAFIEDTYVAGGRKNDLKSVGIMARESRLNIEKLIGFGVEFDKIDGEFDYTREGAHRINRILHCEDKTGARIHEELVKRCQERKNIRIIENCKMEDIIVEDGSCRGAVVAVGQERSFISSDISVFATGGIGGLFRSSTNQTAITGDGIEIAIRNGVDIKDIEKIQFHPTSLYEEGISQHFLVSESLRGEGAVLLNHDGERFVDELKPRDFVTSKIHEELIRCGKKHLYLDARHLGEEFIKSRFPWIYSQCLKRGIDMTKDLVPVVPAQHYLMGGIEVDEYSKTSLDGLYAVGETSCTGVHGNNRLASNSLLEAVVFSRRAALDIGDRLKKMKPKKDCSEFHSILFDGIEHELSNISLKKEILRRRADMKNELCDY